MSGNVYVFPASRVQRQLWFLDRLNPGSPLYNLPRALRLKGHLHPDALRAALEAIVARHESLRTTFTADDGRPMQVIAAEARPLALATIDLSGWREDERESEAERLIVDEARRPFDLAAGPLFRARLLRLAPEDHVLLVTMHHIVSDGWSVEIFVRELVALYEAFAAGAPSPLPPLPIQYADWAHWQEEFLGSDGLAGQLTYWKKRLAGAPPLLDLPTDWPRPALQTFEGAIHRLSLSPAFTRKLRHLSQQEGVTLSMTVQAALVVLLSRYSGQDDLVIGTVTAGRARSEVEGLIGFFANTLPLRVDLSGDPTAQAVLARVRDAALDAYAHQDVPFEMLIEAVQPARSLSHNPVFQVMAVSNVERDETLRMGDLTVTTLPIDGRTAKFDLTLVATERRDALTIGLEYDTHLFTPQTAARMARQLELLLSGMAHDPAQRISRIPLMTAQERRQRVSQPAAASASDDRLPSLVDLFMMQVRRAPDRVAVTCETASLTYGRLNALADQLAADLRSHGVGSNALVGLCAERSLEMVVGILGILKSGGAYVPLDPSYPRERLTFMIEDARLALIVAQPCVAPLVDTGGPPLLLLRSADQHAEIEAPAQPLPSPRPEDAAYVIYTSGSTGLPKGVVVTHRNVVRLFRSTEPWFHFGEHDVWTLFHSYGFDFSVWEIFGALLYGGRLVVVPYLDSRSPDAFLALLEREGVTVLNQTPSAFEQLIQADERANPPRSLALRYVVFGGEALDIQALRPWFARHGDKSPRLVNMYGITETTVHVTYRPLSEHDLERRGSAIGCAIPDLQVHLLDQHGEPVPVGVPGEIHVGGAGVARGYLNRPELTASRFIRDPFAADPDARLYKSGDLARYLHDGDIEYLGRIDQQVKIRGFRVELGEIEAVLDRHPDVRASVVVLREDQPGQKRLVAYVQPANDAAAARPQDLRALVRSALPDYMVPSAFVTLAAFPLTANGKIDRRALPAPALTGPAEDTQHVPPETGPEAVVARIWADVLSIDVRRLGSNDNFFDLGGHSLMAVQVASRLSDAMATDVAVRTVFEHPTIAGLAEALETADRVTHDDRPPLVRRGDGGSQPLTVMQEQMWFLDQLHPGLATYNVPHAFRLLGPLDASALAEALARLAERHEILRTIFSSRDGVPIARVAPAGPVAIPLTDLSPLDARDRARLADDEIAEEIKRPFDLEAGPLMRAALIRHGIDDHVLLLSLHHIVCDGWSQGLIFRELAEQYGAVLDGRPAALPELSIQYGDYARWQRDWLRSRDFERQLSYWRSALVGAPPVLSLPSDRPRRAVQSTAGHKQTESLEPELVARLKMVAQRHGASLFMTLLAAFQTLVHRQTGETDIVVGTDTANRGLLQTEPLVGLFVNNLVLRTDLSGDPTFVELLARVRHVAFGAFAHQDLPFGTLVERLRPVRSLSHTPLFQLLFVLQNQPASAPALRGVQVMPIEIDMGASKFDVAVFATESGGRLETTWVYRHELFDDDTIARARREFRQLLSGAAENPSARLSALTTTTLETERSRPMAVPSDQSQSQPRTSIRGARKAVKLEHASSIRQSFLREGDTLPLVVQPSQPDVSLSEWGATNRDEIDSLLLRHGALLLRGFGLRSLNDFERFVECLCPELFDEYGDLPREGASGKIYKSTPYPDHLPILFHNESSHQHQWPRKIWFHCVTAPAEGGETPLVDCRAIYRQLDPAIRQRFADKGLLYVRNFTEGLDVSWEDFFRTSQRTAVEEYCRKASVNFEWRGENGLRTSERCPAVIRHPLSGELTFFNQIQLHHPSCLEPAVRESLTSMFAPEDLPRNVFYGDGSPIEDSIVQEILDMYWQMSVAPTWQVGDVMMLDNMLTAHARNPFVGPRKIVVAMGELVRKADVESARVPA